MSTLRLYEIAETYLRALEELADIENLPEQAITDTLEGLQGEFEVKAINVAGYIRNIEAEASAVEQARKGMERRQRSLTRHAERLREYVKNHMERTGLPKLKNHYLTLRVQNNPPSVVVDDEKSIPDQYKHTETVTTLLRAEIARALKADQEVPGSHLQRSTRLVIQ
jgi:hypothetical protein